ncbi:MAG: hypothetical protein II877_03785, partial [Synergistaceae bacterium]|nr:hypothetical protein [Synergistaceae bacterium]
MSKIDEAKYILSSLGVPERQRNDLCCYTLLAMASIGENDLLRLIQSFGSRMWEEEKAVFLSRHKSLAELYSSRREMNKLPVKVNGMEFMFSQGQHNILQKSVLEEFAPRFIPASECLYIGDTAKRDLMKNDRLLNILGFNISVHDKMPDIILYDRGSNMLFFIECVTSSGAATPERIIEIEAMTENVSAGRIYITAFPDFRTFKRFSEFIA